MSSYAEGQMHQLADALEKAGATAAEITKLGQSPGLIGSVLGLIRRELVVNEVKPAPILRRLYADKVIPVGGRKVTVHEMVQNADFATMFGALSANLEDLVMTELQRETFCEKHRDKLRQGGYATFFLHKKDETKPATPDNLVVAFVRVYSDGLYVNVFRFGYVLVWYAEYQLRLVSPQFGPP